MPHIKDKNVAVAKAQMAKVKDADLKELTIEQLVALAMELEANEKALIAQAKVVKDHVNKIYGPMCAKKRDLEVKVAFLTAKLERAKAVNEKFTGLVKLSK